MAGNKGVSSMKVCVKRIYCSSCRRLVNCYEQAANGIIHVLCRRCGKLLRVWNGVRWLSV